MTTSTTWNNCLTYIRKEKKWVMNNINSLRKAYPSMWIAVHKTRVVDSDKDYGILARRVYKKLGRVPILITNTANPNPKVVI